MAMGHKLNDVHVLVLDDDATVRRVVAAYLKAEGAIVHQASSRIEALGLYLALMVEGLVPRAVITDWYLADPGSKVHDFYQSIGRPEDATAENFIRQLKLADPEVCIIIHSGYLADVPAGIADFVASKSSPIPELIALLAHSIKNPEPLIYKGQSYA